MTQRWRRFVVLVVAVNLCAMCFAAFRDPIRPSGRSREIIATIRKLASDNGAFEASGEPQWVVDDGHGNTARVKDVAGLSAGSRVAVESIQEIAASGSLGSARPLAGVSAAGAAKPVRRLLVVPMQWGGQTWTTDDSANAKGVIDVLVPWWNKMSAGRETLQVTTAPVLDGNAKFQAGTCNSGGIQTEVLQYITRANLTGTYDNLMVTFPDRTTGCGWGGLGQMPGTFTWTKVAKNYAGVWAHELGHNLGFPHGNLCRSAMTVTYLANCVDSEYGNTYDVMGFASSQLPNAYFSPGFLRSADWLPDDKMMIWNGVPSTYTIYRPDRTDLGRTAIRINPTDDSVGDNGYWLQYNPTSAEYYNPRVSVPNGGVVLTMSPSTKFASRRVLDSSTGTVGSANSTSYLCDITPSAEYRYDDPRLLPGTSWTDPRNRFRITVVSGDGTKADVRIDPVNPVLVAVPATVMAVVDAQGGRSIKVDISGLTPAANEPTTFVVDTVEDPSRTCTADVWTPSCSLTGLARGATYTVRVVAVNGSVRSQTAIAAPVTIQVGPPSFTIAATASPRSVVATVTPDDGGSPFSSVPVLSLADDKQCQLNTSAPTTCSFDNLAPRTTYVLTATGVNAIGTRDVRYSVRTKVSKPAAPAVSGRFIGADLELTATSDAVDAHNTTHFNFYCTMDREWREPVAMDPQSLSATVRIANVKGSAGWCYAQAIASDVETDDVESSTNTSILVGAGGRVVVQRISLVVSAESRSPGKVSVGWTVRDTVGRASVSVVVSKGRMCVRKTSTSCVVRGLRSGAKLTLYVNARGPSGTTSEKRVVLVR